MKPCRAAETSATASGKRTRIASRSAVAWASGDPSTWTRFSAAPVSSTAVFSVSVANCSRCHSCTASPWRSANSRRPRMSSSGSPPKGKPNPPSTPKYSTDVPRFPGGLNEQIGHEFAASQQYVAIAVWYDAQTLPGLAAHFYRQALEERNHAMMIVQYLLDAGHEVVIPGVEAPQTSFADARAPVALALEQERRVTEQIAELARLAREENDLVGEQFLHWFLQEQREEVASMSGLLAIVERASESNILLAEDYLARNQVGDQGESATAPPVAGGAL